MKALHHNYRTWAKTFFNALLFLFFTCLFFSACKKADNHFNDIVGQPYAEDPPDYVKSVLVGDTITLSGKMFIDQGGYIKIGNVKAVLASDKKTIAKDGSTSDEVRIVITKEMGIGSNISVTLVTKGQSFSFPSITIRQFAAGQQRTDTTLFVEKVASFQPGNLSDYTNGGFTLLNNSSIAADGTICFDNPLGVFKVTGGQVQQIIKAGAVLKDDNGSFTIDHIVGSVISYDGTNITFSASVKDNADTTGNYVFRLCQLSLNSQHITTLNRTLMKKGKVSTDGTPGAFEGTASQLKIVAATLRTDANNNLYFSNCYTVESPNNDQGAIYNLINTGAIYTLSSRPYVIGNICKLTTDGKISSLFSLKPISGHKVFNPPGFQVQVTCDYKIAPDGSVAYVYDQLDFFYDISLTEYDLQKRIPLNSSGLAPITYRFISYDSNPVSTSGTNQLPVFFAIETANINNSASNLQPLPNGEILYGAGGGIASLDILNQFSYCYAGTEISVEGGSPPPFQTQLVGKAKNVLFSNDDAYHLIFCGVDKTGAVYYTPGNGYDVLTAPIVFYKIYPKK